MSKISLESDQLTSVIRLKVIEAGSKGVTANKIAQELNLTRSCISKRLAFLEDTGSVYHVRRTRPYGGGHFHTFHPGSTRPAAEKNAPPRRDWLVEAFFGPARKEAA
jgi:predicted transcriptional regulator